MERYRFIMFLDPHKQMESLEIANKKMTEEFNSQRAKMKELFLQKEGNIMRQYYHCLCTPFYTSYL